MKKQLRLIIPVLLAGFLLLPAESDAQSDQKNVSKDIVKVSIRTPSRPSKTRHIENNAHKKKVKTLPRYNHRHMVECPTFASYTTKPRMQREKAMRKKNS